jgi:hypothetical protein
MAYNGLAAISIRGFVHCLALVLTAGLLSSCSDSSSSAPSTGIPINTGTGWSDSPHISRDGKRLYFMYSRYNFGPWIISGGTTTPLPSGPDRPGLHHSANPFDESDVYMASKNPDGTWSEAVNLGLSGAYGDSSGMEINDGNTFIWLQGNGSTNNIVMANKNSDGTWSGPVDLGPGINDHTAGVVQDNPHISPDGQGLWFTSNRPGGVGARDIWFSVYSNGSWSAPINMGPTFNSAGEEDQIWISPIGASPDIYWNADDGIKGCTWNGSTCAAAPVSVTIPGCAYAAEVSMTDDGQYLYFACGDLTTGMVRIMYSVKQQNGNWGQAIPVD